MTTLHSGGKFNSKVYDTSGGLHGVGVSVVNALSETLEVEVARGQKLYRQSYTRGEPDGPLKSLGRDEEPPRHHGPLQAGCQDLRQGRCLHSRRGCSAWRAPRPISSAASRSAGLAPRRCSQATARRRKARSSTSPAGSRIFWRTASRDRRRSPTTSSPAGVEKTEGHGSVEWAIAWIASDDGFLNSYCNTVPTPDGGTHEAGLRAALTKELARLWRAHRQ